MAAPDMTGLESTTQEENLTRFFARLKDLPVSARVVQSALEETSHPDGSNRDIEAILEADAGATADVLRLANSAYYGVRGNVRALSMAVSVIGRSRLAILLRHLLAGRLLETIQPRGEVAEWVQRVSLSTGIVSSGVARLRMAVDPDEMMVAGLLHNVGELALLSEAPEADLPGLDEWLRANESERRITLFGINSLDAGAWLLQAWGFPSLYVVAARHWMDPDCRDLNSIERDYAAFVHLGAKTSRAWVQGLDWKDALRSLPDTVFELTGVTPNELANAYRQIDTDIERLRQSL